MCEKWMRNEKMWMKSIVVGDDDKTNIETKTSKALRTRENNLSYYSCTNTKIL